MPKSVRLDEETEALLEITAQILNATKMDVLKSSIREYCGKTLDKKKNKPYDLIVDFLGKGRSGKANLAADHEKIFKKTFSERPHSSGY